MPPKLKPAKPAKCWCPGSGEPADVDVGEAEVIGERGEGASEVEVVVVVEWRVGEWEEKTVRSFWREREGERRREGMLPVSFCAVLLAVV